MAPSLSPFSATQYSIVIDAGSSGSRIQIYSWQDPEAERQEVVADVRKRVLARLERERAIADRQALKGKGKGKEVEKRVDVEAEVRKEVDVALRRLVKVGKGVQGEDWVKKVEPGISTIPPSQIRSYLRPLLSHAAKQIPPSHHADTPIYLLATAGMRLLPPVESALVLDAVCEELEGWAFDSGGGATDGLELGRGANGKGRCRNNVRIISGEEEGMWGWVAVNYLMDGFGYAEPTSASESKQSLPPYASSSSSTAFSGAELLPLQPLETDSTGLSSSVPITVVDPSRRSPTFGFLDMGGASTQIAFAPTVPEIEASAFPTDELRSVSLKLLSGEVVEWPLFVASWLGFGTNRVRERYIEDTVKKWQDALDAESTSSLASASSGDIPTSAARKLFLPVDDPCLPKGLVLPSTSPSAPSFRGTGSFKECLADLQPLLQADLPCPAPHSHCLFAGLPTPHIDFEREDQRGFIGISEYWYTAQQVLGVGGVWDWGEWEKGMSNFCARDWSDIESEFAKDSKWRGSAVELSRLEMQCFKGAWISNVLHEGIGIPRMYDAGGNETLTGGPLGETNEEAERRAKEKGLLSGSHTHRSHFQSLDHVGETAVSWTLGKMVIEASRGVSSHGYSDDPVGTSRTWRGAWSADLSRYRQALGFDGFSGPIALADVPSGPYLFVVIGCLLLLGVFLAMRNRGGRSGTGRRRKSSNVGLTGDYTPANGVGIEAGLKAGPASPVTASFANRPASSGTGVLRILSQKWASVARIVLGSRSMPLARPRRARQTSAPAALDLSNLGLRSVSATLSQPASPRHEAHYFIPALQSSGSRTLPDSPDQTTPRPGDLLDPDGQFAARGISRSLANGSALVHKSSFTNQRSKRNGLTQTTPLSPGHSPGTPNGWNDPPTHVFGHVEASTLLEPESFGASSVLAPYAGEAAISRDPSRVSLVDYARGLSSRPMSRTSMHNGEGD